MIHPKWFTLLRDYVRVHPDPDVRFRYYNSIVDFLISIDDDPLLGSKILSAMPKDIVNLYLAEQNRSEVKTPLPGFEWKIDLKGANPFAEV